jgi:hypothetical protein
MMDRDDIQAIAQQAGVAAAHSVMRDTWRLLGVDIDDQAQVNEFRADLVHARRWRKIADAAGRKAVLTVLTGALALVAALVWDALKPGA